MAIKYNSLSWIKALRGLDGDDGSLDSYHVYETRNGWGIASKRSKLLEAELDKKAQSSREVYEELSRKLEVQADGTTVTKVGGRYRK